MVMYANKCFPITLSIGAPINLNDLALVQTTLGRTDTSLLSCSVRVDVRWLPCYPRPPISTSVPTGTYRKFRSLRSLKGVIVIYTIPKLGTASGKQLGIFLAKPRQWNTSEYWRKWRAPLVPVLSLRSSVCFGSRPECRHCQYQRRTDKNITTYAY